MGRGVPGEAGIELLGNDPIVCKHRRPRWAVLLVLASAGFLSGCYYYPYGYYPWGYPYPHPYAWASPYPPGAYPPPASSNPATLARISHSLVIFAGVTEGF